MKILVTGGTGFVGSHLIRELLKEKENKVYALIRDSEKLNQFDFKDKITAIHGDIFKSEPFPVDSEMVFHLAALTKIISPQDFFHINEEGTMSLLEKLRPLKKLRKIILLSSLAAAGPNRDHAFLTEDMPENPVSLYGKSKLAQEKICKENSPVPYVIIRAPIVFGPGDLDMLDVFRIVGRGIIPLLGRQERRFSIIYVKDLVRGMVAAAISHFENDIFYIADSEPIEWQSFMHEAADLMGKKRIKKIIIPETLARILAELAEIRIRFFKKKAIFNRDKFSEMKFPAWTCSPDKINSLLHFKPAFSIHEALLETIRWYQSQSLL